MVTKSKYIIEQHIDDNNLLLFSTRTGKFAIMLESEYKDIFAGNEKKYSKKVKRLEELGFIVQYNEQKLLEERRKKTIEQYNSKPTTNYVITPSMNCNARCSYCFEAGAHHDDMTYDVAIALVDYIVANRGSEPISIHWFGGEPLMRIDIIDYISNELKNHHVPYVSKITSNGLLFNEAVIKKAINLWNVQIVQITLDDIEEKYDSIKRYIGELSESPFRTVMYNVGLCLKNNLPVRIRINYNPLHVEKVKEIMDYTTSFFNNNPLISFHPQAIFSDDINIPGICGAFPHLDIHPFFRLREYEDEYNEKREKNGYIGRSLYLSQFIPWCNFRVSANESNDYEHILKKYYLLPIPIHCEGICDNSIAVDSHGDIFVCQRLLGQSSEFASGNVLYGKMQNDIYQYYQSAFLVETKCKNCVLLPTCQGGCKFKHQKYQSNQSCLPIKGIVKKAVLAAAKEIINEFGEIERI